MRTSTASPIMFFLKKTPKQITNPICSEISNRSNAKQTNQPSNPYDIPDVWSVCNQIAALCSGVGCTQKPHSRFLTADRVWRNFLCRIANTGNNYIMLDRHATVRVARWTRMMDRINTVCIHTVKICIMVSSCV